MPTAVFILVAYLIGSLSFAVIVSRAFGLPDPRSYGSGNPGATNVLRTGKKLATLARSQRGLTVNSSGSARPALAALNRKYPARAIIAPLSVQNSIAG